METYMVHTKETVSESGVFSARYFLTSRLNMETDRVNLRIQSKCGIMPTRKSHEPGHF